MYRGDGSRYENRKTKSFEISYSTVSKTLAVDLWQLLMSLGIISRLKRRIKNDGYQDEYTVTTKGLSANHLCRIIGWEEFNLVQDRNSAITLKENILIPIRHISPYPYDGMVYNIGVQTDNSYNIFGMSVHNCLPLVDAIMFNNPVIATAYGGPEDFLTEYNQKKLPYRMRPVRNAHWAYNYFNCYMNWADVDINDLRNWMRDAYERGDTDETVAEQRKKLLDAYGQETTIKIAKELLRR